MGALIERSLYAEHFPVPHHRARQRYYDLIVTAVFATPWTFALAHDQLSAFNQWLGGTALPAFTPFHILFACLMGSVVLVWSLLRLLKPQLYHGRYDGSASAIQ
jgi:hypothetical protein